MKNAIYLGLLSLLLTGCYSYPDTGRWRGSAVFHDDVTGTSHCMVELDLTHDEDFVSLNEISTDCGSRATRWGSGALNVRGKEIWKGERVFGQVSSDGSVHLDLDQPYLDFQYPYPAQRLVLNWTRVGGNLQFSELAFYDGKIQSMDAWLHRDN